MKTTYKLLKDNLEYLKLKGMLNELDETIDTIINKDLGFVEGLLELTNVEIAHKKSNAIKSMVKTGAFPFIREVKDFDFDFQPTLNKQLILDLQTLSFMEGANNVVFLGPSGVGKTHLATAIGITAAKNRVSTYFIKCHDLITQLKKAKIENRLDERLKHFCKYKLLIIDELGYLPIDKEDSKLFFQLIDKRYEKKSIIITTNINFGEWDSIFGDSVTADAIVNRILHHSKIIKMSGKSYRIHERLESMEAYNET